MTVSYDRRHHSYRGGLTPARRAVLEAIQAAIARDGFPPTARQIALDVGLSVSTVHAALERLEREGYIARRPRSPRALRVLRSAGVGSAR